ncbi:MAG TPA: MBL fold metallo-hydrolase [Candidatus Krumholzibacteriaceae bacterium]|nr:MBL fold metallo-hydrolase [Candidatus Krumholzibacteriaceae bacterium]
MKIIIVYDNTSTGENLAADWGFSCFIQTDKRKILFDTGGNGKILLQNLRELKIDPEDFDDIVISHPDFDHIGGLSHILNLNSSAVIHNPISFRGIRYKNEVKYYDHPAEIYQNIFLTGELGKREQSLAVRTENGLILIIGCGHPTLRKIMAAASPFGDIHAIIGGLHGFREFEILEKVEKICPTHCTVHKEKIKELYPAKYIEGGAGRTFKF